MVAEAWASWRREVAYAEQYVDAQASLDVQGLHRDGPITLRELLVHMIEEYARHAGTPTCCASASTAAPVSSRRRRAWA